MIKRVTIGPSIVLIQDTIGDEGEWSTSRIWTLEEWEGYLGTTFRGYHTDVSKDNGGLVRWYKEK
jgi:hypothetical protein